MISGVDHVHRFTHGIMIPSFAFGGLFAETWFIQLPYYMGLWTLSTTWLKPWWSMVINLHSYWFRLLSVTMIPHLFSLTHWGRVTHICVSKPTIIGSDNGLSPGRRQSIIWTNAGILLIGPLGTNFSEILIEIYTFSFKKIHLKMSSGKQRPFCLGLNALMFVCFFTYLLPHWLFCSPLETSTHWCNATAFFNIFIFNHKW